MAKTLQHAFNVVYRHLLKQGRRSTRPPLPGEAPMPGHLLGSALCAYRAPDGCRCAIGVLIPDRLYRPALEGETAASVPVLEVLGEAHWPTGGNARTLYMELQHVHDRDPPELWPAALARVAADFDLKVPSS